MSEPKPKATLAEFKEHCAAETDFLQVYNFQVEKIDHAAATVRLPFDSKHLRPGPTVSGPAMMAIGDYAGLVFCPPAEHREPMSRLAIPFSMWQCAGHGDAAGPGFVR